MKIIRFKIAATISISALLILSGCSGSNKAVAGNSAGNISNTAYVALQGGFIYYATDAIYRIKPDGTGSLKLSDDIAAHLNVADDWIYYSNKTDLHKLYKMKTDGTERMPLNDDVSTFINVSGEWLYYVNESDSKHIYKMKTDGNLRTAIGEARAGVLIVSGDWIYYTNADDIYKLYKMRTDGNDKVKIIDTQCGNINISDNLIYYTSASDGYLRKIRTDGTKSSIISDSICDNVNVSGAWIFFRNNSDSGNIYKIRTDGSGMIKLNEGKSAAINIAGNWVYFKSQPEPAAGKASDVFYRMHLDGSGSIQVQDVLIAEMPTAPPNKTPVPKTAPPPDPSVNNEPAFTWAPYTQPPATVSTSTPVPAPTPVPEPTPVPGPTPPADLASGMALAGLRLGDSYDKVYSLYGKEDSRFPMRVADMNFNSIAYLSRNLEILFDWNTNTITRIKITSPNNENFLNLGIKVGTGIQNAISIMKERYAFIRQYEGLVSGTLHFRFYVQYSQGGYMEMLSDPSAAQPITYIEIMNFDVGFPLSADTPVHISPTP